MRSFSDLQEHEVLALAISNEEEDSRTFADFADGLRESHPDSARLFADMAVEEDRHRHQLIDLFRSKFGEHIPQIRRHDIRGAVRRKKLWQVQLLGIDAVRRHAALMEQDAGRFYRAALLRTNDASIRQLLGDLAAAEEGHERAAAALESRHLTEGARLKENDDARRRFLLQVIQPGLVGLMDGSVSTLAPVFAAAFGTHNTWSAFQVGAAASLGAGISMGFAEALADDGKLSGRGRPYVRGLVCGLMTVAGGVGHTLPYLIPNFGVATGAAVLVVALELLVIAWIQWRFMDTPPLSASAKVMLGGGLVLATGILIGNT